VEQQLGQDWNGYRRPWPKHLTSVIVDATWKSCGEDTLGRTISFFDSSGDESQVKSKNDERTNCRSECLLKVFAAAGTIDVPV
jgi:hypothetical protein